MADNRRAKAVANTLDNANKADATVVLFIRPTNGVYLPPKILRLGGKSALEEIEVVKRDMPNFFVEALTVADGRVERILSGDVTLCD